MSIFDKKNSALIARYEEMLQEGSNLYFDADEIDEIAYQYELEESYDQALAVVEHGLSLHPNNTSLIIRRAKYLLLFDRVEESAALMESIPSNTEESTLVRAEIQAIKGELQQAHQQLMDYLATESVSLEFCFDALEQYIDYDQLNSVALFVEAADKVLADSSELWRELAYIYEEKLAYEEAIIIYNRLLDKNPYSHVDWLGLAKVYILLKAYEKAIEACDFAIAVNGNESSVLSLKGYCQYDMGNFHQAIETFQEFAELVGEKHIAYELIAECYIKLEAMSDAIFYLEKAKVLNPNSSNITYQLANCYYDMGNTPKAEESLVETIRLDNSDAEALAFLGEIKYNNGSYDEAYTYLEQALVYDADNSDILTLMGDIQMRNMEFDKAVISYEKALEINPYDVKRIFKLILAHYNAGDQEQATALIQDLDETTLQLNDLSGISEENRVEMEETKKMLDNLRAILRNALDEEDL